MPRSKRKSKSKSKAHPGDGNSSSVNPYKAPPSSPMPYIPDIYSSEASLKQEFPLSCARDEPGTTKPLLEPFTFVPISSPPPKRGKKSGSKKSRNLATNSQPTRSLHDQENIPNTSQVVVVACTKAKHGKIQVQNSSRVLRPRSCQLSGEPEKAPLDGGTSPSALLLSQGKENEETPNWVDSWDKWANTRGTIRRAK